MNEFSNISPYSDEEAVEALGKVADHPAVQAASRYIFPDEDPNFLRNALKSLHSIDEFQTAVMSKAVEWVLSTTARNFSYDGIENIRGIKGKFLAISNHRDIILDPAITQVVLYRNGIPMTQIAVGDNLLSNKYVEYLIRSNRMIKVIRGIDARSLYLSSQLLSKYIRQTITSGTSSVWIAQKEGRAKNGIDRTEQGLLKMFDMSGTKDFVSNFEELNIVPLSISYEYEPCDILKARELLISKTQKYVKAPNEDLVSFVTGIFSIKFKRGNQAFGISNRLPGMFRNRSRIILQQERPLPGHPLRRRPPHHRRLQVVEKQLHSLRHAQPFLPLQRPLYPGRRGAFHRLHRASARQGGKRTLPQ